MMPRRKRMVVTMNERRYSQLIRLAAVVIAVLMWFVSVQFSVDGFNFVLPRYQWVGILLAVAVTVIELVFNEEGMGHSLTIVSAGLLSYIYGIATNVLGIWVAQGAPDPSVNPVTLLFPAVVGFFLEVAPEPLLMWGLIGSGMRDLLERLIRRGDGGDDLPRREREREREGNGRGRGPFGEW